MSYQFFHAKSVSRLNYQTLRSHSLAVAHISRYIVRDVFRVDIAAYQESAFYAGLLHDAGKALPETQTFFKKSREEFPEEREEFCGVFHQEASWALTTCLNFPKYSHPISSDKSFDSKAIASAVGYAIYWHHSQPVYFENGEKTPCRADAIEVLSDG